MKPNTKYRTGRNPIFTPIWLLAASCTVQSTSSVVNFDQRIESHTENLRYSNSLARGPQDVASLIKDLGINTNLDHYQKMRKAYADHYHGVFQRPRAGKNTPNYTVTTPTIRFKPRQIESSNPDNPRFDLVAALEAYAQVAFNHAESVDKKMFYAQGGEAYLYSDGTDYFISAKPETTKIDGTPVHIVAELSKSQTSLKHGNTAPRNIILLAWRSPKERENLQKMDTFEYWKPKIQSPNEDPQSAGLGLIAEHLLRRADWTQSPMPNTYQVNGMEGHLNFQNRDIDNWRGLYRELE